MKNQAVGIGKLAFHRTVVPDFIPRRLRVDAYYHTCLALARHDGEVDLLDVQKVDNIFRYISRNGQEAVDEDGHDNVL